MPRQSTIIARELKLIRSSFTRIARSFGRISPLLAATSPAALAAEPEVSARRRPRLSPQQRAALKLQGKYMGTMRGLKPSQRSLIKKIRVQKGIRAAIQEAEKLASAG